MTDALRNLDDGRNARYVRLHDKLVSACRALMVAGNFRPSMSEVCAEAKCSLRSGFVHFKTFAAMYSEALDDLVTRRAILLAVFDSDTSCLDLPGDHRLAIVHAVVFGRPLALRRMQEAA